MTTLAVDTPRHYKPAETDVSDQPVIAADIIYEGAAVGDNGSGYMRPLVAGDAFRGFALEKADNAAGSAGDIKVHLKVRGGIQLAVASAAITDVGKAVYASDDNTFVLTQSTNSYIGRITRFVSTGVVIVHFDADNPPLAELGALTDSTGGTAGATIANLADGTTYANDHAAIENNFASLTAKYNALERMVRGV